MSIYFFNLKDCRTTIPDPDGTELADESAARAHAIVVAREAMRNNEARTRNWRIQVCRADRTPLFEVLFASVDETMDHLPNDMRQSVENISKKFASLADTIQDVRMSMLAIRTTIARSEKAPYLATLNGSRLWNGRS
jgi:t-SNARE complex subunit (syntaxin)